MSAMRCDLDGLWADRDFEHRLDVDIPIAPSLMGFAEGIQAPVHPIGSLGAPLPKQDRLTAAKVFVLGIEAVEIRQGLSLRICLWGWQPIERIPGP